MPPFKGSASDEVHPEQGFTDEQLRSIIEENVYEK
jgi:hypothetical protein